MANIIDTRTLDLQIQADNFLKGYIQNTHIPIAMIFKSYFFEKTNCHSSVSIHSSPHTLTEIVKVLPLG